MADSGFLEKTIRDYLGGELPEIQAF